MNEFMSYPEGPERLSKKIVPWYFAVARKLMMKLLVKILAEG